MLKPFFSHIVSILNFRSVFPKLPSLENRNKWHLSSLLLCFCSPLFHLVSYPTSQVANWGIWDAKLSKAKAEDVTIPTQLNSGKRRGENEVLKMKQQTETAFTKGDEGKSNDFFFQSQKLGQLLFSLNIKAIIGNVHRWSSSMNVFGTWINALIPRRFAPRKGSEF